MKRLSDSHAHFVVSAGTLVLARALTALGGFVAAVALTAKFGAGAQSDAYFTARLLPVMLLAPVAGTYHLAFVPVYFRTLQQRGQAESDRLTAQFVWIMTGLGLAAALIYVLAADGIMRIMAPGFDAQTRADAVWMTRIMATAIGFSTIQGVLEAVLTAHRRFVAAAVSALFVPAGALLGVWVLAGYWGSTGLAAGVALGFALQLLCLVPITRPYLSWHGWWQRLRNPALREVFVHLAATGMVVLVWQINTAVDRMFSSLLGEGAVSALSLGVMLLGAVPTLLVFPIYKVMYPELVRLAQQRRQDDLRRLFVSNFAAIAFLTFPMVVVLGLFADPIVQGVFDHGQFDQDAAAQTAQVIAYLGLGLPMAVSAILVVQYFLATRRVGLLFTILVVTVIANALLDWLLMKPLGLGGIALSSSLIALLRMGAFLPILARMLHGPITRPMLVPLGKVVVASLACGAAMEGMVYLLRGAFAHGHLARQVGLSLAVLAGGAAVYWLVSLALRNNPLWDLWRALGRSHATKVQPEAELAESTSAV